MATILGSIWTGVRVVEGAGLENRYTGNGIVGSNPTLSVCDSRLEARGASLEPLSFHDDRAGEDVDGYR